MTKTGRRQSRVLRVLTGVLLLAALGVFLASQWQATQRREAYLPELEAQARRSPTNGPLLALLGGRLAQAGEWAASSNALRQSVAAGENDEKVWLALAASTAASGDVRLARADLNLGARSLPQSPALRDAVARVYAVSASASPRALTTAINPAGPQALIDELTQGSFLNGLSRWWGLRHPENSGFATREDWVRQSPNDAESQRFWGRALMRNRRFADAGAAFRLSASLAPDSPDSHLDLARWLAQRSQPAEAIRQFFLTLKLRPRWPDALLGLGAVADSQNLMTMAVSSYAEASKIDPNSAAAWIGLGRALLQGAGKADQTLAAFQTAARLAPERTDFLPDYATALRQSGKPDEAENLLRRRLAAAPNDAFAHYLLAGLLTDNKPTPAREDEAEKLLRENLRLIPREPLAEARLGQLLLRRHSPDEAVALLLDSLRQNPYNVNAMRILARAFGQTGQPDLAAKAAAQANVLFDHLQRISVLKTEIAKNQLDPKRHGELAELYELTGQPEQAASERTLLALIRADPARAAEKVRESQQEFRQALPGM